MALLERPVMMTTTLTPTVRLNLREVEDYLAGKRDTWVSDDALVEMVDLSSNQVEF